MVSYPDEMSASQFRKELENGSISNSNGRLVSVSAFNQPSPKNKSVFGEEKQDGSTKKFRNKKCVYNDIQFDSELEKDYYIFLMRVGIKFEMKPIITLQEGFRWNGKKIQAIVWKPDFYISEANVYIDTKGFANDKFPIKLKMFQYVMHKQPVTNNLPIEVFILTARNKFEVSRYCIQRRFEGKPDFEQEKLILFKNNQRKYINKGKYHI
jgi:hypothetical protein